MAQTYESWARSSGSTRYRWANPAAGRGRDATEETDSGAFTEATPLYEAGWSSARIGDRLGFNGTTVIKHQSAVCSH
jgi:hypothetical protein